MSTTTWGGHGRSAWLTGHCRCERCRAALLEYSVTRRAVQAALAGREPTPRVDARRARRRVAELRRAGWTVQRIADAAGVSYSTVDRVAHGRSANVALATERAVLGLRL